MATNHEVAMILMQLEHAYDYSLNPEQTRQFIRTLCQFDRVRLYAAGRELIRTSRFFPKISQIINVMRDQAEKIYKDPRLECYPANLPKNKKDKYKNGTKLPDEMDADLIWEMCKQNITDPYLLEMKVTPIEENNFLVHTTVNHKRAHKVSTRKPVDYSIGGRDEHKY